MTPSDAVSGIPSRLLGHDMVARRSFLGGLGQGDGPEPDGDYGFDPNSLIGGSGSFRLGGSDPGRPFADNSNSAAFDPVWGTLGSPSAGTEEDWAVRDDPMPGGVAVDIELFGNGFQISGQLHTGQFDRLSDWINMQTGFIQVRDALLVQQSLASAADADRPRGPLWVRLDQVAMIAERSPSQPSRPGAPVVQKRRRRVSMITPGYTLSGSIHVHAHGSMAQFLETPDPHFLPVTDVTVRWVSNPTLVARFPFALLNRQQLVTILDEPEAATAREEERAGVDAGDELVNRRRWGAA
jgi:hypothetical protein